MDKCLAIECSSELCSVALFLGEEVLVREKHAPREHAYLVLPFVDDLLEESGLHGSELSAVCFGRGPGAFTGLRVAASLAQGLSMAYRIPLLSANSLQALAQEADAIFNVSEGQAICVVLDARMNELYWSIFIKTSRGLVEKVAPSLGSLDTLLAMIEDDVFFLGPGCRYLESGDWAFSCLNSSGLEEASNCFPSARYLQIDSKAIHHGSDELPMPIYLRNNVAAKAKV